MNRSHIGLTFGILIILLLILSKVTTLPQIAKTLDSTPAGSKTKDSTAQSAQLTTTKTTVSTRPVAFTTKAEEDSSLAKGQTEIAQAGQNGVETLTYQVTYTNGTQTKKTLTSSVVTTQPAQEIIEDGTYVAPAATPSPSCYPLTNGGKCYEPGEFCRDSDHDAVGIAGDDTPIACKNNDGWRWEPN